MSRSVEMSPARRSNDAEISLAVSLVEPHELSRRLLALFGPRAVAGFAGRLDPKVAYRWSRPSGPVPAHEALRRLYASYRLWLQAGVGREHGRALAWFLAPHPLLGESQPTELMIDGRFEEVAAAIAAEPASPLRRTGGYSPGSSATVSITDSWHEASLEPLRTVVTAIADLFGARATSMISGESNPKIAYRWVRNEGTLPTGDSARRLYAMYRVLLAVGEFTPSPMMRAWFLAANPSLRERSPLEAACAGGFPAVGHAADQFLVALVRGGIR
jgi:hypothetical protein